MEGGGKPNTSDHAVQKIQTATLQHMMCEYAPLLRSGSNMVLCHLWDGRCKLRCQGSQRMFCPKASPVVSQQYKECQHAHVAAKTSALAG
eukprot:364531-Chlamydomonas_euryale.AAC.10